MSDQPAWNRPDAPQPEWGQQPPPPPAQPGAPVTGSWAPSPQQPPPPATAWQPPPPAAAAWQPLNAPGAARPTNTLAILSLIFALVFSPAGLVLGFLARQQIRERNEGGEGLALAGLIIGIVGTAILVLACIGSLGNA